MDSVDLLSSGLLEQFKGLKKLEESLTQLLLRQSELLNSNFQQLDLYTADQEIPEVEHMMKKMNFYRLKLRTIRSDMMYIAKRVGELKRKSLEIQTHKVEQKAAKEHMIYYETALVNNAKV